MLVQRRLSFFASPPSKALCGLQWIGAPPSQLVLTHFRRFDSLFLCCGSGPPNQRSSSAAGKENGAVSRHSLPTFFYGGCLSESLRLLFLVRPPLHVRVGAYSRLCGCAFSVNLVDNLFVTRCGSSAAVSTLLRDELRVAKVPATVAMTATAAQSVTGGSRVHGGVWWMTLRKGTAASHPLPRVSSLSLPVCPAHASAATGG